MADVLWKFYCCTDGDNLLQRTCVFAVFAADHQARDSALRPKVCLLANHETLRTILASKLMLDWSPEQISAWLKVRYPNNESMRVSHETIYRSLFI